VPGCYPEASRHARLRGFESHPLRHCSAAARKSRPSLGGRLSPFRGSLSSLWRGSPAFSGNPRLFGGAPRLFWETPRPKETSLRLFWETPRLFRTGPRLFGERPRLFRTTPRPNETGLRLFWETPRLFWTGPRLFGERGRLFGERARPFWGASPPSSRDIWPRDLRRVRTAEGPDRSAVRKIQTGVRKAQTAVWNV
jgi:hypothetical protein